MDTALLEAPDDIVDVEVLAEEQLAAEGLIPLTQTQVNEILEKVRLARLDAADYSLQRTENWDAYLRRPYGNEIDGRSKYVSADVKRQVEQTYPVILKQSISTSQKVRLTGPDEEIAAALRVKIQQMLQDLGIYRIYSSVIKDGLVGGFGAVKLWWARTYRPVVKDFPAASEEQLEQLRMMAQQGACEALDVEPNEIRAGQYQAPGAAPVFIQGAQTYRVRATVLEQKSSTLMIKPVPPEELLIERGKAEMNDRKGIGLERVLTVAEILRMQKQQSVPGKPFFRNLQWAIDEASGDEDPQARTEREARESIHFAATSSAYVGQLSADKLKQQKKLVEWVDYVDQDGEEVWARIWILGRTCVRCEPNEDGIVPYCGWSPTSLPHSVLGLGIASDHTHEQKMRSSLGRALMDQIGFSIDREVFVATRDTDIMGLQKRYPGKVIVGIPGQEFVFGDPPKVDTQIYQGMEWISNEQQATGPSNPLVWGGRPDPREKTATASKIRSNASMWRLDTVALNYTEQCLCDVYNKAIYLLQQNLDAPEQVLVDGKLVTLTPQNIQGPYAAVADYQLEADFDNDAFMKSKMMADDALACAQKWPMLYPLGVIAQYRKDLILASGQRSVGKRLGAVPTQMEGWFPGAGAPGGPGGSPAGPPLPGGPPRRALAPGPPRGLPAAPGRRADQAVGQGSAQPNETMMGV